jgi:hypothetical protein
MLWLPPIFGLQIGNPVEFPLIGCDHDQLMGAGGGGDEDVVGPDRQALSL